MDAQFNLNIKGEVCPHCGSNYLGFVRAIFNGDGNTIVYLYCNWCEEMLPYSWKTVIEDIAETKVI